MGSKTATTAPKLKKQAAQKGRKGKASRDEPSTQRSRVVVREGRGNLRRRAEWFASRTRSTKV
jgi:hypothetical protein